MKGIAIGMDVEKATKYLIVSIQNTSIYKNFELQQEKVNNLPELKEKIDEFRKRNYELQTAEETEDIFEKLDALESEYAAFRENPLVDDFLAAELSLCRMMQEVYENLTEAVNI